MEVSQSFTFVDAGAGLYEWMVRMWSTQITRTVSSWEQISNVTYKQAYVEDIKNWTSNLCSSNFKMLEGPSNSYTEFMEDSNDGECGMWEDAGETELDKW